MCLLNGVSNLPLTSLDIMDSHHANKAAAWGAGKQRCLPLPSTRKDGAAGTTTPSSTCCCSTISQTKPPNPAKNYKISRDRLVLPQSPHSFLMAERKGKHFVIKKVKGRSLREVRLHWLEWDCLEESRSVMDIQTMPGCGWEPRCGLLGEALWGEMCCFWWFVTPQALENRQPGRMECIAWPGTLAEGATLLKLLKHAFSGWLGILPLPLPSVFRRGRQLGSQGIA